MDSGTGTRVSVTPVDPVQSRNPRPSLLTLEVRHRTFIGRRRSRSEEWTPYPTKGVVVDMDSDSEL